MYDTYYITCESILATKAENQAVSESFYWNLGKSHFFFLEVWPPVNRQLHGSGGEYCKMRWQERYQCVVSGYGKEHSKVITNFFSNKGQIRWLCFVTTELWGVFFFFFTTVSEIIFLTAAFSKPGTLEDHEFGYMWHLN